MAKVKSIIYAIIGTLLFGALAKGCFSDYKKGGNRTTIQNCEKILADNSFAIAEYDESYTEQTIKIMRIPTKTYMFTYKFDVDGKIYNGGNTFTSLPTSDTVRVFYLKNNPNINYIDPTSTLKSEKEKDSSNGDLYWGIGWSLMALIMLASLVSAFKRKDEIAAEE
jgi:hypothetical protein